jgi:hypothetical protein
VIQGGENLSFPTETLETVWISGDTFRKGFDRDVAPEFRVRARKTIPMPPSPRRDVISKDPTLDPISSSIAVAGF